MKRKRREKSKKKTLIIKIFTELLLSISCAVCNRNKQENLFIVRHKASIDYKSMTLRQLWKNFFMR